MEEKTLQQIANEMRNQYFRELRKKDPEKEKQRLQRYWLKKAAAYQAEQNEKENQNESTNN